MTINDSIFCIEMSFIAAAVLMGVDAIDGNLPQCFHSHFHKHPFSFIVL